jgi:tetratricopeptide (TPR) repeat protein
LSRRDASTGPLRALGEADLFTLAGEAVRQQALDYVLLDRVERPRVAGDTLRAEVAGHRDVYAVSVRVRTDAAGRPQVDARCGCEARRQPCRHAMAVLYAWVRQQDRFLDVDAVLDRLAARPASECLGLIRDVAAGNRDLDEALAAVLQESAPPDGPGEALERWDAFRSRAMAAGRWPAEGLALWEAVAAGPAPVAVRQMAWLLRLLADEAPGEWLSARRAELLDRIPSAPTDAAPAVGDLALADGDGGWAEAASRNPPLADALEAHLETALWSSLLASRLAGGPAAPRAVRAAAVLAALARHRGGPAAEAAFWAAHRSLPGALAAEARALSAAGRWPEAAEAWRRVVAAATAQEVPAARRELAQALRRAGRHDEALPHLLAVWEAAPSWAAWEELRDCAEQAGRSDEARLQVRPLLERSATPLAARVLAAMGDGSGSAGALGAWLAAGGSGDPDGWAEAAAALEALEAADPLAALRLAREALLVLGRGGAGRPPAEVRGGVARRLVAVAARAASARGREATWDRWRREMAAACADRAVRRALEEAAG